MLCLQYDGYSLYIYKHVYSTEALHVHTHFYKVSLGKVLFDSSLYIKMQVSALFECM